MQAAARDARWYFLDLRHSESRFRYIIGSGDQPRLHIHDRHLDPTSAEAAYCVLPGEDSSRRPTLERISDELLQSVEALALEELALDDGGMRRQYLPLVITTARLFLCDVGHGAISLETGELPSHTAFTEVPVVRFRKTLWSSVAGPSQVTDVYRAHQDRERSILVLSSTALPTFLHQVDPDA